ncbi:Fimbrin [Fusarium euwallaceae]|uniref:Fimbrin n=5 Tax=Fusarium solani species complex TaxID=232080 RepID=A0A3M2SFL3_9HYPO|nr:Fimbrin [Fusarium kuroshium]RSL47746.1 Fimbrin [Fusarium sp. AF-6]RSL94685.1 Fimbrin [Fusarium oligoseptatum]RTE75998.1 Fimbrin [Fusarium euwallaceae]
MLCHLKTVPLPFRPPFECWPLLNTSAPLHLSSRPLCATPSPTMNVLKLQRKFPQFQQNEIFSLSDAFQRLDVDDKGYLDEATAIKATQQSENQPYDVVRQALKEVELDSSRRVELEDYVSLISKLRESSPAQKRMSTGPSASSGPGIVAQRTGGGHASKSSVSGKIHVQGSNANITHTINEDERTEFTRHINAVLAGDPDIDSRLPFPTDTFEMFDECKDGLVLAKLINDSVPDTIDERVLNIPGRKIKNLNAFHMSENNNIVIESAKGIGCSVVNIGAGDIIEVREHLILGLIWQIIRRGLLGKIDIKLHPELYRLLEEDETLEQFLRLPPEQILLRWFNYHLKAANWGRKVNNFSSDVKDGENYAVLLAQIGPEYGVTRAPLQKQDLHDRAEAVLQEADKLGCRKFLTPKSLVAGNPKLNLAFVANLFNNHPALDPITEEEKLEVEDFDAEGEREARVFTLWLNSLDVQPAVVSFFDDLRDGSILLQAYDKVIPGSVNPRHVNKRPAHGGEMSRFKAVENTNYAIELGKQNRFSLVGIQGADITDGQRTLTLGLVWQLMRKDITVTLSSLAQKLGKREITDSEMVRWANDMSRKGGRNSAIRSFKDPAIGSGIFLLDVLNGMKSSYVDYDLVTPGQTDEDAYMNAKLSISIARKLGATIWLVPEDICQVRSRLVTTFIGSLMATHEKM